MTPTTPSSTPPSNPSPAPTSTAPAVRATGGKPSVDPQITAQAEEMLGVTAGAPLADETADYATSSTPADAGQAEPSSVSAAQSPAGASEPQPGSTPATPQAAAGDDVIAEFAGLQIAGGESKTPTQDDLSMLATPEGFGKAINPDGKTTSEDQIRNAQSLLGKWSGEVGNYRKQLAELGQWFEFPADGKPRVKSLLAIADGMGADAIRQELAGAGLKLVPLDSKMADGGTEPDAELINELVPDKDLSVEEKQALINDSPALLTKFTVRTEAKSQRAKLETQAAKQREAADVEAAIGKLKTLPYYEQELAPAMRHYHEQIPLDKPLTGRQRVEVLRLLAEGSRAPVAMKRLRDAVRKQVEQEVMRNLEAGSFPGAASPATHVPMNRGGRGDNMVSDEMAAQAAAAVL